MKDLLLRLFHSVDVFLKIIVGSYYCTDSVISPI